MIEQRRSKFREQNFHSLHELTEKFISICCIPYNDKKAFIALVQERVIALL